ncbi:MAG: hypothetical protein ACI9JZ_001627 [Lentimonas sp.]|jgi:hypothetical protein
MFVRTVDPSGESCIEKYDTYSNLRVFRLCFVVVYYDSVNATLRLVSRFVFALLDAYEPFTQYCVTFVDEGSVVRWCEACPSEGD